MNVYRFTYKIYHQSDEYRHSDEIIVVADSSVDALRKGIDYIIADRERWGYMCDYDGANIFVCYHNGNLCETYTDLNVRRI